MDSTVNIRRCKKVKFKCKQSACTSSENGSIAFIEQSDTTKSHIDCQPPRSFSAVNHMLTFLLIFSYCTTDVGSSVVNHIYRSRSKRFAQSNENNATTTTPDLPIRPDTVCNRGTLYECVCNRSLGNLDDRILLCDRFSEEKSLTILSLTVHNIDLDVRLHTNEPYQDYFRRRIANIVSQYCRHQANECPGTILTLNKNNVIILLVNYLPHRRTEIQIVVSKESMPKRLNEAALIDPKTVKYILDTQLGPLSRVLGGVQIEKLELVKMDRKTVMAKNNSLINLLAIIVVSMVCCYAVACFKVWRDTFRKRQYKKKEEILAARNKQNYGTCTYKLMSSCEAPNGKVDFKSNTRQVPTNSSTEDNRSMTHSSKHTSKKDPTQTGFDINKQNISQSKISLLSDANNTRSFQRMFACDLSQLPAESCDLAEEGLDTVFVEDSELNEPQASKYGNSVGHNYSENLETHFVLMDSTSNLSATNRQLPPIVPIFIGSGSEFSINKEPSIIVEKPVMEIPPKSEYVHQNSSDSVLDINHYFQEMKSSMLSAENETAPYARPLSRRGSRDSTPEQGEEFADNFSVESLEPLGDKNFENHQSRQIKIKTPEIRFDQSSSESEDETNELYHKLNDDHDDEEVDLNKTQFKINEDSDDELLNESRMLERHAYGLLEESPLTSPSSCTISNLVADNTLLKNNSNDVMNDLVEKTLNDYEDL